RHPDWTVRNQTAEVVSENKGLVARVVPQLVVACKDRSSEVRRGAIRALVVAGPDAKAAVPVLAEILWAEMVRTDVVETVVNWPPVRFFYRYFHPTYKEFWESLVWEEVIAALAAIGPDAHDAIPVLVPLLGRSYRPMRSLDYSVPCAARN